MKNKWGVLEDLSRSNNLRCHGLVEYENETRTKTKQISQRHLEGTTRGINNIKIKKSH